MMSKYRTGHVVEALFLIALGIFSMVASHYSTWGVQAVLGWALTFAGGVQLLKIFMTAVVPPAGGYVASAILYLLFGIVLLIYPHVGILSIAFIILMLLMLEGGVKVYLGAQLYPLRSWKWMALNGILSWIMALIIWKNWPDVNRGLLGLLIGINLFYYGLVLLGISVRHHHQTGEASTHLR